jgi:hypothetical protein
MFNRLGREDKKSLPCRAEIKEYFGLMSDRMMKVDGGGEWENGISYCLGHVDR